MGKSCSMQSFAPLQSLIFVFTYSETHRTSFDTIVRRSVDHPINKCFGVLQKEFKVPSRIHNTIINSSTDGSEHVLTELFR